MLNSDEENTINKEKKELLDLLVRSYARDKEKTQVLRFFAVMQCIKAEKNKKVRKFVVGKFFQYWCSFHMSQLQKHWQRREHIKNFTQKTNTKTKHKIFLAFVEIHKKSFFKFLFNQKSYNHYKFATLLKFFKILLHNTYKKQAKKSKLINSIIFYNKKLKFLTFSALKFLHNRLYLFRIKMSISINFSISKLTKKSFQALKLYHKVRGKKISAYKKARINRVFDLQADTIKKWISSGTYFKAKNDEESYKSSLKNKEKTWKLVQKIASIWIGKIRKRNYEKPVQRSKVLVPPVTQTHVLVCENSYEPRLRPPPRRLNPSIFNIYK